MNVSFDQLPLLKRLWKAGLSALDCGKEIGLDGDPQEIREAVLRAIEGGAAYPSRQQKVAKAKEASRERREKSAAVGKPAWKPAPTAARDADADAFGIESDGFDGSPAEFDLAIPEEQRKQKVADLDHTNCHWPVGHPRDPGFFFCGGGAVPGEAYCPAHCRIAYNGRLHRRAA